MKDYEIETLQQKLDKKRNKELLLRKSDWDAKKTFYTYCEPYRKIVKLILNANVGNEWSKVYSKITEKVPPLVKQHLVDRLVYFPDRTGKYERTFDPNHIIQWSDVFYVTSDGILQVARTKRSRHQWLYPRRKKVKKSKQLDPLFKFDYDLEIRMYALKRGTVLGGRIYVETGTRINDKGEEVPQITYFTKDQFMDWAHRHKKTYRLKFISSSYPNITTHETITKTHYDD